MLHGVAAGFI